MIHIKMNNAIKEQLKLYAMPYCIGYYNLIAIQNMHAKYLLIFIRYTKEKKYFSFKALRLLYFFFYKNYVLAY